MKCGSADIVTIKMGLWSTQFENEINEDEQDQSLYYGNKNGDVQLIHSVDQRKQFVKCYFKGNDSKVKTKWDTVIIVFWPSLYSLQNKLENTILSIDVNKTTFL